MEALTTYLDQLGRYPLLTTDEEIALAYRIRKGHEDAKQQFIESNLRLVVFYAQRYKFVEGVEVLDLIQVGNLGLVRAVDRYNPESGNRFSTYADAWIRKAMLQHIRQNSLYLTTSVKVAEAARAVEEASDRLAQRYGRTATLDELVEETGMAPEHVSALVVLLDSARMLLDAEMGEDEDAGLTLADIIPDPTVDVEAEVTDGFLPDRLRQAFEVLDEDGRVVLVLSFGLNGGEEMPLDQIAVKLGYSATSKAAVHRIKERALRKLRESSIDLIDFLYS